MSQTSIEREIRLLLPKVLVAIPVKSGLALVFYESEQTFLAL